MKARFQRRASAIVDRLNGEVGCALDRCLFKIANIGRDLRDHQCLGVEHVLQLRETLGSLGPKRTDAHKEKNDQKGDDEKRR